MAADQPASSSPVSTDQETAHYAAWRAAVTHHLFAAQMYSEANGFEMCGQTFGNFQVAMCDEHPEHEARIIPFTCHLRFCPDCERREQARKVARYVPILKELAEDNDHPNWTLKKLDLTTPFSLRDPDAAGRYEEAWDYLETMLNSMFLYLLRNELTAEEKRRQRVSYTKHGVGILAAAEFGEHGLKLHFHLLMFSPYIAKHKITELWKDASGGTCEINWIRKIDYHGVEDAVKEQVKYVTKFQELPPQLVPVLVDVLDGSRRLRTYGVLRGQPEIKHEMLCACGARQVVTNARHYFMLMIERNFPPQLDIATAGAHLLLDLKPGNNSGDQPESTARSDPDLPTNAVELPGFESVEQAKSHNSYYRQ